MKRKRIVPRDGVLVFELRIVHWFDGAGELFTQAEVLTEDDDPNDPSLVEVLGAMEIAKGALVDWYAEGEGHDEEAR